MDGMTVPSTKPGKPTRLQVSNLHRDPEWPRWMPGEKIRVMVASNDVVVRQCLKRALAQDAEIEIVGTAATGELVLQRLDAWQPHLVILDQDLPGPGGMEVLQDLRRQFPGVRVLLFCSSDERGVRSSLDALALGVSDYLEKVLPLNCDAETIDRVGAALLPKIKAIVANYCRRAVPRVSTWDSEPRQTVVPVLNADRRTSPRPLGIRQPLELVVIGVSTGGPNALAALIPSLPRSFRLPILLVQHMPPMFTRLLAERLDSIGELPVREAKDQDPLEPGMILIAPGDYHMHVVRKSGRGVVKLSQEPRENSCRPAVDVLFRSASEAYGAAVLAVVLTGMGKDGLDGAASLRQAGATIIVQDEATSVVWGMPGFVTKAGLADHVLAIDAIGPAIAALARMEGDQRA